LLKDFIRDKTSSNQLLLQTLGYPVRIFKFTLAPGQLLIKYGLTGFNEKSGCNTRQTGIQ
jgi:hypothetical protein